MLFGHISCFSMDTGPNRKIGPLSPFPTAIPIDICTTLNTMKITLFLVCVTTLWSVVFCPAVFWSMLLHNRSLNYNHFIWLFLDPKIIQNSLLIHRTLCFVEECHSVRICVSTSYVDYFLLYNSCYLLYYLLLLVAFQVAA